MDDLLKTALKKAGVSDDWLEIADDIGHDRFLSMWKKLSDRSKPGVPLSLPKFKVYLRCRRDLYIKALAERGMRRLVIENQLKYEQGKAPSLRHIQRIIKAG